MSNIKNNIISLIVTVALFLVSTVGFIIFANSDNAKNSDIDATKADSSDGAVYYTVNGDEFKKVTAKATGDFGKGFSDITVRGELSDTNGNIDFVMENGKITASYVTQSSAPSSYGYDSICYETDKKYTVDSDTGADDTTYYGYVYYSDEASDSQTEDTDESKEKCKYLESSTYFTMAMCEDKDNVYTTINTSKEYKENEIENIKSNAIYKFDKSSKETKKLIEFNNHTEGEYVEGIACNDKYIYLLTNKAEKYNLKVYDKDSYEEVTSSDLDIYVNIDTLAKKMIGEYEDTRKVSDYEIQDDGYTLFASEKGLVLIKRSIVAEIDKTDPKHYGEKGYSNIYEEKGIEPFVKEVYAVSSFSVENNDIQLDNTHVCVTNYIYDYVIYKGGLTYVLTNVYSNDSDVLEKVKVTSLSNGKIFEEIYINLNKISNTSGDKHLKYLQVK